jgi:hypothetical protein
LHEHDIDHRRLVDNQQVAVERVVVAALEAATLGSTSNRFASHNVSALREHGKELF